MRIEETVIILFLFFTSCIIKAIELPYLDSIYLVTGRE